MGSCLAQEPIAFIMPKALCLMHDDPRKVDSSNANFKYQFGIKD